MLPFRVKLASTALALVLGAQAAQADLTPAQVWEDWRAYLAMASEVSGDAVTVGNTLTVSNVQITPEMEPDQGTIVMTLGTLVFTDNGDGTVGITMPPRMPIAATVTPESGSDLGYQVALLQNGLEMNASGTPADIQYAYLADRISLVLEELVIDGTPIPPQDARFEASLFDLSGTTNMALAALRSYTQTMTAARVEFDVAMKPPQEDGAFETKGGAQDLRFSGSGAVPLTGTADVDQMLGAGLALDGTFVVGAGQSDTTAIDENGTTTVATTSKGASIDVKMSSEGLTYDVTQNGLAVDMTSNAAPFPISFSMAQSRFNLTMPLQKSEDAKDFAFGVALSEFAMSDVLWGLFDPMSKLPRDPATIALDLTGKARLLFDFLDPAAGAVSGNPNVTPAEVEAVDINTLQVSVAGADLTGEGAFTFENAPTGGLPKPTGAVDLKLVGGNVLLDTLVEIGLLPQDQAMGARMMMGLFAVPGEGEDTLTSRIEVNEEGHVIANGQRIQ